MLSVAYKKRLATAMAGAALASALAVSGASAVPAEQIIPRTADDSHKVPPPPSSIAASAAEEYQDLRSPDAVDAARAAGDAPDAVTRDLRSPDTRDAAEGYSPTLESQPVAGEPSEPAGFDLVSAAIGAVAAGALSLVLMASLGLRRPPRQRPSSA
jgi:hypothetical protein